MKVTVFGAGNMGARIAEVFLKSGHDVTLIDIKPQFCEGGKKRIIADLEGAVARGKMKAEDKDAALARLTTSVDRKDAAGSQFVMEVILEKMELKEDLLRDLETIVDENCVIGTNTSALSITEIASAIPKRAHKVIGVHFFNPAHIMKLVEVTRSMLTDDETFQFAFDLMASLGKTPVAVNEGSGFVVNRILIPMINEAIGIYADGIATPSDIDLAMQLGAGLRSGPLHTGDLVGHDINLAIMETLYREFGDAKYRPHPLLKKMVRAGLLGQKTGKGFFTYDGPFGKEIPGGDLTIK
jgi:3-hydroxybutyryl-CoA dehydrogenase